MDNRLRRAAGSVPFVRRGRDILDRRHQRTLEQLPAFAPRSGGPARLKAKLAVGGATRTVSLLERLVVGGDHRPLQVLSPGEFRSSVGATGEYEALGALFQRYGSDKSTMHDYHLVYAAILEQLPANGGVLEIGLGTNSPRVVSTMAGTGHPGSSLRAFRDMRPGATVYGADVDRSILFQEDRIQTFVVDQTDSLSVQALEQVLPEHPWLIVDDGLHSPDANLQTLHLALRTLPVGGWIVIEDITPKAEEIWRIVTALMPPAFDVWLVRATGGDLFIARRDS